MIACMTFVLKLCPHSPDFAVAATEQAEMSKPGPKVSMAINNPQMYALQGMH